MQGSHPCSSSPFGGEGVTPSWAGTSAELEFRLRFPAAEWLSSGAELGTELAAGKRSPSKRSGERRSPRLQEMFSEGFSPSLPTNAEPLPHRKTLLQGREILCSRGNGERFHSQNPEERGRLALGTLPQQFAASRYHHQKPVVRKEKILRVQAEHLPGCAVCPFPEEKLETHEVKTSGGFWRGGRCAG